jgi:hypothetical protein
VNGHVCAQVALTGPVTGSPLRRWAIVTPGPGCAVVEACRDTCTVEGGVARCIDCGWIHGELDALPCGGDDSRCQDTGNASACIDDPANPGEPACRIRQRIACAGGCADGVCSDPEPAPCADGSCAECGNGRCEIGETVTNCGADCTCRAACYFGGYDRDEAECPAAYAACYCGDRRCEAWERDGAYACPSDCGGP